MKEVLGVVVSFALVLALVWFSPGWWRQYHAANTMQPSIATIQQGEASPASTPDRRQAEASVSAPDYKPATANPDSIVSAPPTVADIAKLPVRVMNGGAPKGSAAKALEIIKTAGYKAATVGNATGDYTGVSVYYAKSENKADAEALRILLSKTYPNASTQAVSDSKSEAASSPIVVIVGK